MSRHKILYAEDDHTLAYLTKDNLEQHNYEVSHFEDGRSSLEAFKQEVFDLCVFDIMLPKLDGFALASEIRKINSEIPIIFLSAKTLKEDRIKGLRLGADDYLVKPFSIEELLLKIGIFLKRSAKRTILQERTYAIGNYSFDTLNYTLHKGSKEIVLTKREADLLKLFMENANIVLKREDILKTLWGDDDYFMGRSLDVFISRLRKILSDEKNISIENIHGVGFRFLYKIHL
jgi:DNA-binding response OmpR family regulator